MPPLLPERFAERNALTVYDTATGGQRVQAISTHPVVSVWAVDGHVLGLISTDARRLQLLDAK